MTIAVNPGDPGAPAPTSGPITWTFEVGPQTNLQTFRTTINFTALVGSPPVTTSASTGLTPGNTAPAQISTQGQFDSPRGCRGTFGSVGTANASRIEADFTGVDCNQATFRGSVVLRIRTDSEWTVPRIDRTAPRRFLDIAYQADDWIAVFLKLWYDSGEVVQRVGPLATVPAARAFRRGCAQ